MRVAMVSGAVFAVLLADASAARGQSAPQQGGPAAPSAQSSSPGASGGGEAATPSAEGRADSPAAEFYAARLRGLQQRIAQLRADVTGARIDLEWLGERVLGVAVGGARVRISHENAMGPLFRPVRVTYTLDGAPLMTRADDAGLGERASFVVYNGALGPGEHTVTVTAEYVGYGFEVFRYAGGYRFRVQSAQSFSVPEGRALDLHVVGFEQGGAMTAHGERPALRFQQRVTTLRDLDDAR